ncbi:hypothetical protein NC652_001084 [Populus alba x Populus x berolinensis]|nr:hypothetical protein NC652_001084 [Populus alba x Populus x berolinensis]
MESGRYIFLIDRRHVCSAMNASGAISNYMDSARRFDELSSPRMLNPKFCSSNMRGLLSYLLGFSCFLRALLHLLVAPGCCVWSLLIFWGVKRGLVKQEGGLAYCYEGI